MSRKSTLPAVLLLLLALPAAAQQVVVARFSQGEMGGWQEKSFTGHTQYRLTPAAPGQALHASSRGAASGLFKEISIDLDKTPWLNWSWRIDNTFNGNDERSKKGDDYPARIYIVASGGLFFWKTRAINYVWSSHQPIGSEWDNAYTGNAKMVAVESGNGRTGKWLSQRRNIRADLERLFGEPIRHIDAVAIMTDSDNTGATASAYYGDIYFSSE